MKDEEKKIQWTKGTDKNEIEVTLEWWRNELGNAPSDKQIEQLEKEVLFREQKIKNDSELNNNRPGDADMLLYVEKHKEVLSALSELLKEYKEKDISNLSKDQIYNKILNTHYGISAGKYAFFDFIKSNGSYRNHEQVLKDANKIHLELKGSKLHENKNALESRRSQFRNDNQEWQSMVKEILKPFS